MYKNVLETIGNTPMVELTNISSEYRILAKLERANPGASIKDRPAYRMIQDAMVRGELKEGGTVIEATSGNMGIALAMIGAVLKLRVILVMPSSMSVERRTLMKAYGAELMLVEEGGMKRAVEIAEEQAAEHGYFLTRQFENASNRLSHHQTAEEIYRDTDGKFDAFVAGAGTSGTISGVSETLRDRGEYRFFAAEPKGSPVLAGGVASPHKIQGIGANFVPALYDASLVEGVIEVDDLDAIEMARRLAKEEGILSGISSGANVVAALEVAKRIGPGATVVTVLPDTGERYLSTILFQEDE